MPSRVYRSSKRTKTTYTTENWRARAKVDNREVYLGEFSTWEEAKEYEDYWNREVKGTL